MFLAGILALWMLFAVPCPGCPSSVAALAATNTLVSATAQSTSALQSTSPSPTSSQSSSGQSSPPAPADKSVPAAKPKHKKKKVTAPADPSAPPPKKVVSHGSTEDTITNGASDTDEQSTKTRAANTDLLNQATANLEKVSGRSLTAEQKETADQIRKFVDQSKAANQEGDLQRAGTLANKAKLLSDSLEETTRPK